MDNRRMYCIWSDRLKGADVVVGNSVAEVCLAAEDLEHSIVVRVKSSGDMEFPFTVGSLKFKYCYLIKRKVGKKKYTFTCPFCGKVHTAAKKSQWGNVKCPYCKVVASFDKWEVEYE